MLRHCLVPALALGVAAAALPATAQRDPAPISQGRTSGDLALTADQMRAVNAAQGARITGLESDLANLSGELETLKFLLSQSRGQINDMQADDAVLERLIRDLEDKAEAQENLIEDLMARLDALESGGANAFSPSNGGLAERTISPDTENVFETASSVSDGGQGGPVRLGPPTASNSTADTTGDGLPQGSLGTISATDLPGEAGPLFADAKSRLLRFDYAGAEAAFRAFLDRFSDDPQAGEAQYWLGESLYQQEAYSASGQAYTKMIRDYPDDPRAPEALAKLARSMRLIGDTEKACGALNLLPQRYPNASGVTKNLAAGERARAGCDS